MPAVESFDVVIIGGGAAGVSCSLELKDNLVRHALLERSQELGGQLSQIHTPIKNLGIGQFANGTALQNQLIKSANERNLPFRLNDEVIAVNLSQKTVKTRHGSLIGKALVLATGARMRRIEIEEGAHLAEQILYRLEDKESKFEGKSAIVIGGDELAVLEALWFAKNAPKCVLVCHSDKLQAGNDLVKEAKTNKRLEILLSSEIRELMGKDKIEAVRVFNHRTQEMRRIPIPLVVAKIGMVPNTELFTGQLDLAANGCIKTNVLAQTSLPGIFAVGDVAFPSYWRLSTAIGQGTVAARAAMEYLAKLN
ncbi:MAG: hypothetical protein C5B53_01920 [Candidatus Melainabacteria bacterium]|nr:MAG: hypothetical protein C5B53_01920 [Candidatus Melainabacteria bacterium]